MPAGSKRFNIDGYAEFHYVVGIRTKTEIQFYSAGSFVGLMDFFLKDQVPTSTFNPTNSFWSLNMDIDRYPAIIGTLRYEKPLFVYITWDANNNLTWAHFGTSDKEPIGQQEGV
jgi:hypothetical protein